MVRFYKIYCNLVDFLSEKEESQMEKKEFLNPEADVIKFEAEDVITLSYGGTVPEGGGPSIDVGDLFG